MIQKLQRKFILIAMSASIIVTGSIFGIIIFNNYKTIDKQNDGILNMISENDGQMPDYKPRSGYMAKVVTKEFQFTTRYFYVKLNTNGEVEETNLKNIAAISKEEAENMVNTIIEENKETGYFDNYKYKVTQKNNGKLVVILDCQAKLNNFKATTEKSMVIIFAGLSIVFIIISISSKRVLQPIIKNVESQKQFITNAGHELKTPVAVILANMDVMEMSIGENNEWVKSTKKQAKRLDSLIKSLLNLAKVEEEKSKVEYTEFSITKIIKEEIGEFKALAQNKNFIYDDSKDVNIRADLNSISQLVTIFLDNAVKYTPDNGTIKIITEKVGKNTKIQFMNDCKDIKSIKINKLFDRFYREDKARSQKKDGYGIGLSIVKSIVELHKGKIEVSANKSGMICFTIII